MELRLLKAFVVLAEELHFGRAAALLGIAQPPLSMQIKALETSLGLKLFDRDRRHVALTQAGQMFLPEAKAVLAQHDKALRAGLRLARGELGRLEIGFTTSAPLSRAVPHIIGRFRRRWPDVQMSLREMSTREQLRLLAEGDLDLGFIRPFQGGAQEEMALTTVMNEPLVVAVPSDHPLATRHELSIVDLAGLPFILSPRYAGTSLYDKVLHLCRNAGFEPRTVLEAHQMTTTIGMVAAGMGIAVVPQAMCHIQLEGAHFLPLVEADATMELAVVHRPDDERPPVRNFMAVTKAVVAVSPS